MTRWNGCCNPESCASFSNNLCFLLFYLIFLPVYLFIILIAVIVDFFSFLVWTVSCGYCFKRCSFEGLCSILYEDVEHSIVVIETFPWINHTTRTTDMRKAEKCSDVCCSIIFIPET